MPVIFNIIVIEFFLVVSEILPFLLSLVKTLRRLDAFRLSNLVCKGVIIFSKPMTSLKQISC